MRRTITERARTAAVPITKAARFCLRTRGWRANAACNLALSSGGAPCGDSAASSRSACDILLLGEFIAGIPFPSTVPSALPARGAAAKQSSQAGTQAPLPHPHNSFVPDHRELEFRGIPQAAPELISAGTLISRDVRGPTKRQLHRQAPRFLIPATHPRAAHSSGRWPTVGAINCAPCPADIHPADLCSSRSCRASKSNAEKPPALLLQRWPGLRSYATQTGRWRAGGARSTH